MDRRSLFGAIGAGLTCLLGKNAIAKECRDSESDLKQMIVYANKLGLEVISIVLETNGTYTFKFEKMDNYRKDDFNRQEDELFVEYHCRKYKGKKDRPLDIVHFFQKGGAKP